MRRNMSSTDRVIRMIITGILASLYFTEVISGLTGIWTMALAVVFAWSSLTGSCPFYLATGISTFRLRTVFKK
ncbi:MAG: DUF2892 domain-containing protein [Flavobacteriaceae bacterium]|nr:DUF2892 domain-containing protein [Flavobacteriaceae bacterium]